MAAIDVLSLLASANGRPQMSVQTKILLVLGAALAAGLAALAVVLLVVVTPAFDRLDVEQAEKNVNRVQQTIANEFAVLDQKVVDWAHWDESYAFVQSGDAEYVTNNLQPGSLTNLGVSFMAFYNVAGKPVWTGGFDPETEEPKDLAGLNDPAQVSAITVARTEDSRHGLLQIDGKIYLVSAIDILDSNENGPAQGTWRSARRLTTRCWPISWRGPRSGSPRPRPRRRTVRLPPRTSSARARHC